MHDVAIVGAGPGRRDARARARRQRARRRRDRRAPAGVTLRQDRSLALSCGSRLMLERLGVWTELEAVAGAVTPIVEIDVSQAAASAWPRSRRRGRVAGAGLRRLVRRAAACARRRAGARRTWRFASARVAAVDAARRACGSIGSPTRRGPLAARLAAVADGSGTAVDGIARERHDYRQHALVAALLRDPPRRGVAYERFTPDRTDCAFARAGPLRVRLDAAARTIATDAGASTSAFLMAHRAHASALGSRTSPASGDARFRSCSTRARPVVTARRRGDGQRRAAAASRRGPGFQPRPARRVGAGADDARTRRAMRSAAERCCAAMRRGDGSTGARASHSRTGWSGMFGDDLPLCA